MLPGMLLGTLPGMLLRDATPAHEPAIALKAFMLNRECKGAWEVFVFAERCFASVVVMVCALSVSLVSFPYSSGETVVQEGMLLPIARKD